MIFYMAMPLRVPNYLNSIVQGVIKLKRYKIYLSIEAFLTVNVACLQTESYCFWKKLAKYSKHFYYYLQDY